MHCVRKTKSEALQLPVVYASFLSFIIGPRLEHMFESSSNYCYVVEVIKSLSSAKDVFVFSFKEARKGFFC